MAERLKNWGFPRWGGYGVDSDATTVRMCDYVGCDERGDYPAPKAPGSNERWYFCQAHAAEYNRNWDFFAGMSDEQARAYAEKENRTASGFRQSGWAGWGGATDESGFDRQQRAALKVLDLDVEASGDEIKSRYRQLAKQFHPDANPDDPEAERRFQQVQAAYQTLKSKVEERQPGSI